MTNIHDSLQLVQIESDAAYIDSRVYCREIIQVDHSDWLQNILYTHQSLIEHRFGRVHFENGYVNIPNGGKKSTKYALLTEAQCNACLVLSKNLAKTVDAKFDLVAEFQQAKAMLRSQLERQLERQFSTPIANNTDYSITCWGVWRDSGIRNPYYVKRVILDYYDHQTVNQIVCVTQQTYEDLMENFRAMDGADISNLPPDKQRKFRAHSQQDKMNRREPQQRDPNYGYIQLSLFG